jgi:hypothetical protein
LPKNNPKKYFRRGGATTSARRAPAIRGDKISNIQQRLGPGQRAGSDIGIARGTSPGTVNPLLAGLSNEELAELDRLQFNRAVTRDNPLAGVVGGLGLTAADAVKAIPGATGLIGQGLGLVGADEAAVAEFTTPTEHTSRPSLRQAGSNLRGVGQGLGDIGRALVFNRQTGGQVPQDNPFGGMRIPTEFLVQQFINGGQVQGFATGGGYSSRS